MINVLFVDDEQSVLDGLRRSLQRQRRQWDMRFACGAAAALEALQQRPADAVVSDMRMPGMDGAALLTRVAQEWPEALRIVLSGYTDRENALRLTPIAHQFVAKPCPAGAIEEVVGRLVGLRTLLADETLRQVTGRLGGLPSAPAIHVRLTSALGSSDSTIHQLAEIVSEDPAIAAKALQLANSPFFGPSRRITRIEEAVAYLGTNTLRGVVLGMAVLNMFRSHGAEGTRAMETARAHAIATAGIARSIMPDMTRGDDAFAAGLLHDVGWLVIASRLPEVAATIVQRTTELGHAHHEIERELLGVTHAEVGAYLLGLWGLPSTIVEAVANHHTPGRVPASGFDVVGAVHIANAMVRESEDDDAPSELDQAFVHQLGAEAQLPRWKSVATSQLDVMRREALG